MMPELLAPAGNMECLQTALHYGADAVYIGLEHFGLRAFAENFTAEELLEARRITKEKKRRLYVAINALMAPEDLTQLKASLELVETAQVDAVIFSDPAVLMLHRQLNLSVPLHLSTQASTMNPAACCFWMGQGVSRIILARELSLAQIRMLRAQIPQELELETFVHGAMCVAYSGRCLLSAVTTGRSGNGGSCAQPCRWYYEIGEPGSERFPITQTEQGTFILNSKDLMMIDHLQDLIDAGIDSFKIEGRMKSIYYVATVVRAYRQALDALERGDTDLQALRSELLLSATRQMSTGFFYDSDPQRLQDVTRTEIPRRYTFAAKVLENDGHGYIKVEQRNKFQVGETLELLPGIGDPQTFRLEEMCTETGEKVVEAPHAQQHLLLACPLPAAPGDLLRRLDCVGG